MEDEVEAADEDGAGPDTELDTAHHLVRQTEKTTLNTGSCYWSTEAQCSHLTGHCDGQGAHRFSGHL